MAAWPEIDELKQLLDVPADNVDWDGTASGTHFTRLLSAAIDRTKREIAGTEVAYDDLYEEPTDTHAQIALRMAELLATRPDSSASARLDPILRGDPTLRRLMLGQRRVFGVA